MGCNNAKLVQVSPTAAASTTTGSSGVPTSATVKDESRKASSSDQDNRGSSAVSKISKRSGDSGFDGDPDEMAGVITEDSDEKFVKEIEDNFTEREDLDLCLIGIPAPRNTSARDKQRMDEQRILESLRSEGLIARNEQKVLGGYSFDIVAVDDVPTKAPSSADELDGLQRPSTAFGGRAKMLPARLAKLERSQKKRKVRTEADIVAKLERAEQRRKELENEKLNKINALSGKAAGEEGEDAAAKEQAKELQREKEEAVLDNKVKRLTQLREKLRAKEEHAAKVRERRRLAQLQRVNEEGEEAAAERERMEAQMEKEAREILGASRGLGKEENGGNSFSTVADDRKVLEA